jgi:hypothetical protein
VSSVVLKTCSIPRRQLLTDVKGFYIQFSYKIPPFHSEERLKGGFNLSARKLNIKLCWTQPLWTFYFIFHFNNIHFKRFVAFIPIILTVTGGKNKENISEKSILFPVSHFIEIQG